MSSASAAGALWVRSRRVRTAMRRSTWRGWWTTPGRRHMSCTDSCLTGSDTWLLGNQLSSVSSMGLISPWASNRALRNTTVSTVRTRSRVKRKKLFVAKCQARPALQGTDSGCFWSLRFFSTCSLTERLHGFPADGSQVVWTSVCGGHCDPKICCQLEQKCLSTDPVFHFKKFWHQKCMWSLKLSVCSNVAVLHVVFIVINHCFTLYCITQKRLFKQFYGLFAHSSLLLALLTPLTCFCSN